MKYLWIASVLGLAIGVGLGPMVGALVDASQSSPPTAPGAFLATAATRLREFQYRVGDLRARDLIATVAPICPKQDPRL